MSLEQALNENNELLKEHNSLLKELLAKTKEAKSGKDADAGEKTKEAKPARRGRAAKEAPLEEVEEAEELEDEDDGDNDAPSLEKLTANIKAWINEFGGEGSAEYDERKGRYAAQLKKLNAKRLAEVDPKKLSEVAAWFEKIKAKGKLVADADDEDDDM